MKLFALLLSVAFLAACCATEEDKHVDEQVLDKNSMAAMSAVKATMASATKMPDKLVTSTERTNTENQMKAEALLIELPTLVNQTLQADKSKPLAGTGFITKTADIYEIENKSVKDKIQSRQISDSEQHICNYGSVVIYSDVPCRQVTNVKVTEVEELDGLDEVPAAAVEQEDNLAERKKKRPNKNGQKRPNKNGQKRPNKNGQRRPNKNSQKRPNQNAQKRPNKNGQKRPNQNAQKRPNKNGQKRPNQNAQTRPNQNGQKRPNKNGQKRPNKNGQKLPNKTDSIRPAKNGQKRPISANNKNQSRPLQQNNRRQWEDEEEGEYDDDKRYFQNQRIQAQHYVFDYDDY